MEVTIDDYVNYKLIDHPLKIEKIEIMTGANYFSAGPIILFRLNLCEYNEVFTNQIDKFYEKLVAILPSLYEHHCSPGRPGGFFERVKEGTLLGHVSEHVAIELQTLAGMDVGYGKTRSTLQDGVFNVIFRYFDEVAGVYAGKAAFNLINSLLLNQEFDVKEIINNLIDIRERRLFGPSTQAIVDEANHRKIPYLRIDSYNLVQLGTGKYHKKIQATITSDTGLIAVETADDKYLTTIKLKDAGIPVPETIKTNKIEDVFEFYQKTSSPIVIKPRTGNLGKNLRVNLTTSEEIIDSFNLAIEADEDVLVQPYIIGNSYRLLVIDYVFVAATMLKPPSITGDGISTIEQLIEKLNSDPERQIGDKGKLSKVESDFITDKILSKKNYTLQTILAEGEFLRLKNSGNLKLGGTAIDVTDEVHPFNKFLAERTAKIIGLNVAGIDILASEINTSIIDNNGVVLEVNAAPDFRMHINPAIGNRRNVAANMLDMLFPKDSKSRVPIFSITGTVGKSITAYLLNHCLKNEGYQIGLINTDGLFITNKQLMYGDMTFPEHVRLVLSDPTIDCAILETSREGILRKGLGYQFADFGIVLNLHDDHVGNDDIKYIEDLAYAKSVVAEEVYETGFTILNADNDFVYEMKNRLYSKLVLFSSLPNNPNFVKHIQKGGMAVNIKDECIYLHNRNFSINLIALDEVPLTYNNKAKLTYDSLLATVAALYAFKIPPEKIKFYLKTFEPDINNLPGRLNFIGVKNFKVLLDYAHNSVSFEALKNFLANDESYKIGILDAAGDRSDETIINLGIIASQTYNELFLYEGIDSRGREKGEVLNLLKQGALSAGFDETKIKMFFNPEEAWESALKEGKQGYLIVILSARSKETIKVINKFILSKDNIL